MRRPSKITAAIDIANCNIQLINPLAVPEIAHACDLRVDLVVNDTVTPVDAYHVPHVTSSSSVLEAELAEHCSIIKLTRRNGLPVV